jgi:phosphoserine phosphatase
VLAKDPRGQLLLITKGAPEVVLDRCVHVPAGARSAMQALFSEGARVVAVAARPAEGMNALTAAGEQGLTLEGFLSFADRPKPDAGTSIAQLERLGVEVKIITGDNGLVAAKVCSDIGVDCAGVLSGTDLESIDDDHLQAAIMTTTVFARISPDQKSRIIRLARRTGKDVAFLGDGVNDAVALHHADVGISVDSATDVAKEAADVVLLDKDLGVLADGVMEGRRIFANTMKYVLMATSSNFGNMFSAAGASVFLTFLPMLPSQILLNNLLYNTGQLVIPTDRVDPEALARPAAWEMKFIRNFMCVFGPISSIFDFLTFWGHARPAPRRPYRTQDRLVRRVNRHPNPGHLRDPHPAGPVLQKPPQPADAVRTDRRGPGRRDPSVHGPGEPAGLHAAAGHLLPAAVRHGDRLPATRRAGKNPVLPHPPHPRPPRPHPTTRNQPRPTPGAAHPPPRVPLHPPPSPAPDDSSPAPERSAADQCRQLNCRCARAGRERQRRWDTHPHYLSGPTGKPEVSLRVFRRGSAQ